MADHTTYLYKGVGVGTHWHNNDPMKIGLSPRLPGGDTSPAGLIQHVTDDTRKSPFISLSLSFSVAKKYALDRSRKDPTQEMPAYVYQIELSQKLIDSTARIIDPVKEIAEKVLPNPEDDNPYSPYQHDGHPRFLLGIVAPNEMPHHLQEHIERPLGGGTPRTANLTQELEAIVRALRDSEILILGNIPLTCVTTVFDVYKEPSM